MAYSTKANVRIKCGLSTTEVADADLDIHITRADKEIDIVSGRLFTGSNAATEYYGPFPRDMFGNYNKRFSTNNYPIQTITSIKILSDTGSTIKTLATTDYVKDNATGRIVFLNDSIPEYERAVEVIYTYGYASVPTEVAELSECLAGIRAWTQYMGGQFNRLDSYSIPEMTMNKGDFYQRGQQMIEMLKEQAEVLWTRVGKRVNIAFASGSGSSPSTYYGGPGVGR